MATTAKPKNPPAFPMQPTQFTPGTDGMTLRDYFAAKAMQAEMITTFSDATPKAAQDFIDGATNYGHTAEQHLAFNAYRIADAMLAERERCS